MSGLVNCFAKSNKPHQFRGWVILLGPNCFLRCATWVDVSPVVTVVWYCSNNSDIDCSCGFIHVHSFFLIKKRWVLSSLFLNSFAIVFTVHLHKTFVGFVFYCLAHALPQRHVFFLLSIFFWSWLVYFFLHCFWKQSVYLLEQ